MRVSRAALDKLRASAKRHDGKAAVGSRESGVAVPSTAEPAEALAKALLKQLRGEKPTSFRFAIERDALERISRVSAVPVEDHAETGFRFEIERDALKRIARVSAVPVEAHAETGFRFEIQRGDSSEMRSITAQPFEVKKNA